MSYQENSSFFEISHSDTLRFRRIVLDVMSEACRVSDENISEGIGTLGEKQMHAAIKRFICPDREKHEVIIDGSKGCINSDTDANDNDRKKRRFVADILDGNTIYEIQTGQFAPLKNKISWVLENTSYNIVVIHPIAETKWINLIDRESGDVKKRYRSPVRGKIYDIAPELYAFEDFIACPRFSLVILIMEAEQYKKNISKSSRPRYKKYELIPVNLLRAHIFKSAEDYKLFVPDTLPEIFTVKQYSEKTGIRGIEAYSIVKTLCHIGLLRENGKIGRAAAYSRCP